MASSINASTSGPGGVITTADNSGILNIQTANTNAIVINSSQQVTAPSNPAFFAGGTSSAVATTASAWTSVPGFSGGSLSQKGGSNFNASTATFTAPVAGWYQFNASTACQIAVSQQIYLGLGKNQLNSSFAETTLTNNTSSTTPWETCLSGCINLAAGDTVSFTYYSTSASTTINTRQQYFSGFLIG